MINKFAFNLIKGSIGYLKNSDTNIFVVVFYTNTSRKRTLLQKLILKCVQLMYVCHR